MRIKWMACLACLLFIGTVKAQILTGNARYVEQVEALNMVMY